MTTPSRTSVARDLLKNPAGYGGTSRKGAFPGVWSGEASLPGAADRESEGVTRDLPSEDRSEGPTETWLVKPRLVPGQLGRPWWPERERGENRLESVGVSLMMSGS